MTGPLTVVASTAADPTSLPVARAGHRAAAVVRVEAGDGRNRITQLHNEPPLTFRSTPDGLVWVGTAAGPIGGDELTLDFSVGAGADVAVRSAGAALVLPGPHGQTSSLTTTVSVAAGASLWWYPEPTIVVAGADHVARTTITLAPDAELMWVEEVVLGRHDEEAGRLRSRLRVETPCGPVLATGLDLGRPGWDGPAGLGAGRAVAQVVLVGRPALRLLAPGAGIGVAGGPGCRLAVSAVDDRTALVNLTGPSTLAVRHAVDAVVSLAGPPPPRR